MADDMIGGQKIRPASRGAPPEGNALLSRQAVPGLPAGGPSNVVISGVPARAALSRS
jgi:hypothetical protein